MGAAVSKSQTQMNQEERMSEEKITNGETDGETRLVALLAALRLEPTPEADFEERFIYDLHERIVRDAVCCPVRFRLFDHLLQFIVRRRVACGASTLGFGALVMGCFALFTDESEPAAAFAAAPTSASSKSSSAYEESLAGLAPSRDADVQHCTSISVNRVSNSLLNEDSVMAADWFSPEQEDHIFASDSVFSSVLTSKGAVSPVSIPRILSPSVRGVW